MLIFKAFIACCIYTGKFKLFILWTFLQFFLGWFFFWQKVCEVSEKHNSLGVGEDKNQKVKFLLLHIFKMLSHTHMMGRIQDVRKPEGEPISNYCEDSLEILPAQLWWNYLYSRLTKKTNEKVFYSSLKRENANKMVMLFLLKNSHGVCHWGSLVLQNKIKSKEMHLLKTQMRRQKLVCLIYLFI